MHWMPLFVLKRLSWWLYLYLSKDRLGELQHRGAYEMLQFTRRLSIARTVYGTFRNGICYVQESSPVSPMEGLRGYFSIIGEMRRFKGSLYYIEGRFIGKQFSLAPRIEAEGKMSGLYRGRTAQSQA